MRGQRGIKRRETHNRRRDILCHGFLLYGQLCILSLLCERLSLKCAEEIATLHRILRQLLQETLHSSPQLRTAELLRRQFIALQDLCECGIEPLVHIAVHERGVRIHESRQCRYDGSRSCGLVYGRCLLCAGFRRFLTDDFRRLCRHILCVLRRRSALRLRHFRLCCIGGSHTRL